MAFLSRIALASVLLCLAAPLQAAEPVAVAARSLGDLLVNRELRAPAIVLAANQADVKSQVSALVAEVLRDVGDSVTRGELLIRLDDDNARLALAQARASLRAVDAQIEEARSRLARAEELLQGQFISEEELIARQASLNVLLANRQAQQVAVELAELELSRTRIEAPFTGSIIARTAQVGNYAQPGTPLLTVVQTDRVEIDVELDPRYAAGISGASGFAFHSQGQRWPVELLRLSQVIDVSSRLVRARFEFTGEAATAGTAGQLVWNATTGAVPPDLMVQRGDDLGVFVVDGEQARFVPVPDAQQGRAASLELPADSLVITRGQLRLQHGDAIRVSLE